MLRIYADFNGLVSGPRTPSRTAVVIDTLGSVRDLSNAGVVMKEGLELTAYDESDGIEDLEGRGVTLYDRSNRWWVVELDEAGVRYVPAAPRRRLTAFLCIGCRKDIAKEPYGFPAEDFCPHCDTPIRTAIAPP